MNPGAGDGPPFRPSDFYGGFTEYNGLDVDDINGVLQQTPNGRLAQHLAPQFHYHSYHPPTHSHAYTTTPTELSWQQYPNTDGGQSSAAATGLTTPFDTNSIANSADYADNNDGSLSVPDIDVNNPVDFGTGYDEEENNNDVEEELSSGAGASLLQPPAGFLFGTHNLGPPLPPSASTVPVPDTALSFEAPWTPYSFRASFTGPVPFAGPSDGGQSLLLPPTTPTPPSTPNKARSRKLKNREETAKIRNLASCRRCKILKVSCHSELVCKKCVGWDTQNGNHVCIRENLVSISTGRSGHLSRVWPCTWLEVRGGDNEFPFDQLLLPHVDVELWAGDNYPLNVQVRQNFPGGPWSIIPPKDDEVLAWAENHLLLETRATGFHGAILDFLIRHTRSDLVEKNPLVRDVVALNAMWAILRRPTLFTPFPASMQAPDNIQTHLGQLARRRMAVIERSLLDEVDKTIPPDSASPHALWAALWGVSLVYFESLEANDKSPPGRPSDEFQTVTGRLLTALIVVLANHFRTTKIIKILDYPTENDLPDPDVRSSFQRARDARRPFYNHISQKQGLHYGLVKKHIIKNKKETVSLGG